MAKPVDQELKRAFAELQHKMINTTQKLRLADIQIETLKRQKNQSKLMEREIGNLDPKTRVYESVGRMFVITDVSQVRENLQKRRTTAEEKIMVLHNNKNYLERSLQEAENDLCEMVQQRK